MNAQWGNDDRPTVHISLLKLLNEFWLSLELRNLH